MNKFILLFTLTFISQTIIGQKVKFKKGEATIDGVPSFKIVKSDERGETGLKISHIKDLKGKTLVTIDQINIQTIIDNKFIKITNSDSDSEYLITSSFFYTNRNFSKNLVEEGIIEKGGNVNWEAFDNLLKENHQGEDTDALIETKKQLTANQDYKYPIKRTRESSIQIKRNNKINKAILVQEGRPFAIYEFVKHTKGPNQIVYISVIKNLRGALIGTAEKSLATSMKNHVKKDALSGIMNEEFGSDKFILRMATELIKSGVL